MRISTVNGYDRRPDSRDNPFRTKKLNFLPKPADPEFFKRLMRQPQAAGQKFICQMHHTGIFEKNAHDEQ